MQDLCLEARTVLLKMETPPKGLAPAQLMRTPYERDLCLKKPEEKAPAELLVLQPVLAELVT